MRRIASGIDRPVFVTAPPGDTERLFIVAQRGQILVLNLADDSIEPTPFLSVLGMPTGGEQGLLGLAFHPDYATNGLFFVHYNQAGGASVVEQYSVSADPDVAATPGTPVITVPQPQTNHNGGWIGFGPLDDLLYIALGDGGGGNDNGSGHTVTTGNSQDITNNLLGKILRLDIDSDDFPQDAARNYAIPSGNPFAGATPGDDEIWSYGLRNPYRASFDRDTGELYIGDVGQNNREEINVEPPAAAGTNYGWRLREGTIATPTPAIAPVGGPAPAGAIDPIFDYPHSGPGFAGCSVTGGVVYRGPVQSLRGRYFFGDFCTGKLWSLRFDGSMPSAFDGSNFSELTDHTGDPEFTPDVGSFAALSGFGEDDAGNLYVLKLGVQTQQGILANSGEIWVVPEPAAGAASCAALLATFAMGARRPRLSARRRW